jgi:hypothetical protein
MLLFFEFLDCSVGYPLNHQFAGGFFVDVYFRGWPSVAFFMLPMIARRPPKRYRGKLGESCGLVVTGF